MHDDFYQMYLDELETIVPCSEAETKTLVLAIKDRKPGAAERLIEGKLKLVLAIAKAYRDQGVLLGDLVQEANMALTVFSREYQGLPEAFDEGLALAVRSQLEQVIQELGKEKELEAEILARVNVLQEVSRVMAEELGREATVEELAKRMKMTVGEIKAIMKITLDALTVSS